MTVYERAGACLRILQYYGQWYDPMDCRSIIARAIARAILDDRAEGGTQEIPDLSGGISFSASSGVSVNRKMALG